MIIHKCCKCGDLVDPIYRVSPKGEDFVGICEECVGPEDVDPIVREIADTLVERLVIVPNGFYDFTCKSCRKRFGGNPYRNSETGRDFVDCPHCRNRHDVTESVKRMNDAIERIDEEIDAGD